MKQGYKILYEHSDQCKFDDLTIEKKEELDGYIFCNITHPQNLVHLNA